MIIHDAKSLGSLEMSVHFYPKMAATLFKKKHKTFASWYLGNLWFYVDADSRETIVLNVSGFCVHQCMHAFWRVEDDQQS